MLAVDREKVEGSKQKKNRLILFEHFEKKTGLILFLTYKYKYFFFPLKVVFDGGGE